MPGDIKSEDVQGIDSYVGRSKNTYMQLEFGYGMYSFNLDDFKGRADYQEVMADIGGKRAKVATFSKMQNASEEYLRRGWFSFGGAGAYFGDVHDGNKLGVVVYCKNSADLDVAKKIVYSIKFSGR